MDDFFGLEGKAAIVVGGGLGIGESTSLYLARAGCDVAVVDIDAERAERVADKVRALGRKATAIVGDALDPAQAAWIIDKARADLGRLDKLVTIIGIAAFEPTLHMTPETWDKDQSRNLRFAFFLAQQFALRLIEDKRPGSIVFICSVSGLLASIQHVAYGAAKAGLINLAKTLAVEWAAYGIRVNALSPGGVDTPRIRANRPVKGGGTGTAESPIPMQRPATTDEIAGVVLFLVSDLASYVTGHNLHVDGGWMAANVGLPLSIVSREA